MASFNGPVGVMLDVMKLGLQIDSSSADPRANRDKATAVEGASGQASTPLGKPTAPEISLWALLKEVVNQAKGSDLVTGYSFVYVWLANQFGHFMIGFAGTILCGWFVSLFCPNALITGSFRYRLTNAVSIGFLWFLVWIAKEIFIDLLGGLRSLRFAKAQREAARRDDPPLSSVPTPWYKISTEDLREISAALRAHWRARRWLHGGVDGEADEEAWLIHDIVRDSKVDGWFYLAGVLTAIAMYAAPGLAPNIGWPWLVPITTFIVVLAASLPISRDWLWEKVAFDKAALPFVGRFALNSRPYQQDARRIAIDFAIGKLANVKHLIIIGPPKSGRTTTAIALGVEALLRSGDSIVVYTTWFKLLDGVAEEMHFAGQRPERQGPPGDRIVFPPERAKLLIVDDVGAEGAGRRPFVTADAFSAELQRNEALRVKFENKRVVWVIGDNPEKAQNWAKALRTAYGHRQIEVIAPGETLGYAERRRTTRPAA